MLSSARPKARTRGRKAKARVLSDWKVLESGRRDSGARRVAIANQKGGVGKSTTAVNLGAALALRGRRTLVVDVDPQANATTGLGIDHRRSRRSTYDLLLGAATLAEVAAPSAVAGLDCAPASPHLAGAEVELVAQERRAHRLAEALAGDDRYDVVLLDCPPSLGLLTVNALVAATDLVVPVQCEYYALEGLGQLLDTAERVRSSLRPELRISGFLLTMYDARTTLSSQVADEVRGHFGRLVFSTVIPRSVRLAEAPSFGEPVITLDPGARGSIAHKLLAAEFEQRFALGRPRGAPPRDERSRPAAQLGTTGPTGRGFGTVAPEPKGLDDAYPRPAPWEPAG